MGDDLLGILRIKVIRGVNLAVRDAKTSDPYVIVSVGTQKVKTRTVKNNCNPEWNDEVTVGVKDLDTPIRLTVFDQDTFSDDDRMGEANIDIKPYVQVLRQGLSTNYADRTVMHTVEPTKENNLADESPIILKNGKLVQEMILRLSNVETGEIEIEVEWVDIPRSE